MKIIHESGEGDRLKLCKMLMVSQREDRVVASFFCVDDVRHSSPPPPRNPTWFGSNGMVWSVRYGEILRQQDEEHNKPGTTHRHHANAICKY